MRGVDAATHFIDNRCTADLLDAAPCLHRVSLQHPSTEFPPRHQATLTLFFFPFCLCFVLSALPPIKSGAAAIVVQLVMCELLLSVFGGADSR